MKEKKFIVDDVLYYYLSFVYMELLMRAISCRPFLGWGILFMFVFAVVPAFFLSAIGRFTSKKVAHIVGGIGIGFFFVLYSVQTVYHNTFGKYMIIYSFFNGGATQIVGDGVIQNALMSVLKGIPAILGLSVPLIFYFVLKKHIRHYQKDIVAGLVQTAVFLLVGLLTPVVISAFPIFKPIQTSEFDADISVREFGLLYTESLDVKYNVFGVEQELSLGEEIASSEESGSETEVEPDPGPVIDTSPNVSDVDFAALAESEKNKNLKALNSYFAEKRPTNKNEYTGMYKGYNLISITAEGFSPYAIDPELTPTLYKMSQEGFKFTNFYTPIWGVSTSDGEYTHCTGLIPKSGVWSFYRSGNNYMPYCLGNMFKSIGLKETYAYHNHTYTYYSRDVSHPNMGYNYKGIGNGLEGVKKCWPESDLEMINSTVDEYLKTDEQFHAYYMTVSGHLNYSKVGNSMSAKNWHLVEHLDCSDEIKAYIACNIELDRAMEELLRRLNEAGVADKTVITITPDHYPYGLEKDGTDKYAIWRELLGHEVDSTFELYESSFILYCQGTENAPTVDKYCQTIDILPTVLNLFGFDYDSRLLMGSDIMSTEEQLVILSDRSFITEKGKYDAKAKKFYLFPGEEDFASEEERTEYINRYKTIVSNKFQISAKMLETDYYGYVFNK